jgi:superfamily II DNA helicase RecQ
MSTFNRSLDEIIDGAMSEVHCRMPYDWQQQVVRHCVMMTMPSTIEVKPRACLCLQSTGGGKSAVRDTVGWKLGGITLTIVPHLSIGSDQTEKLETKLVEVSER